MRLNQRGLGWFLFWVEACLKNFASAPGLFTEAAAGISLTVTCKEKIIPPKIWPRLSVDLWALHDIQHKTIAPPPYPFFKRKHKSSVLRLMIGGLSRWLEDLEALSSKALDKQKEVESQSSPKHQFKHRGYLNLCFRETTLTWWAFAKADPSFISVKFE